MKEEKFKKVVMGATVAAVLLLAVLLIFLVYQLIAISVRRNREAELTAQIEEYLAYIDQGQKDLKTYTSDVWLEILARELGMKGLGDIDWDAAAAAAQLHIAVRDGELVLLAEVGDL